MASLLIQAAKTAAALPETTLNGAILPLRLSSLISLFRRTLSPEDGAGAAEPLSWDHQVTSDVGPLISFFSFHDSTRVQTALKRSVEMEDFASTGFLVYHGFEAIATVVRTAIKEDCEEARGEAALLLFDAVQGVKSGDRETKGQFANDLANLIKTALNAGSLEMVELLLSAGISAFHGDDIAEGIWTERLCQIQKGVMERRISSLTRSTASWEQYGARLRDAAEIYFAGTERNVISLIDWMGEQERRKRALLLSMGHIHPCRALSSPVPAELICEMIRFLSPQGDYTIDQLRAHLRRPRVLEAVNHRYFALPLYLRIFLCKGVSVRTREFPEVPFSQHHLGGLRFMMIRFLKKIAQTEPELPR